MLSTIAFICLILTINDELRFGTDLANTVLGLANVDTFVGCYDILYDEAFVFFFDVGSAFSFFCCC